MPSGTPAPAGNNFATRFRAAQRINKWTKTKDCHGNRRTLEDAVQIERTLARLRTVGFDSLPPVVGTSPRR